MKLLFIIFATIIWNCCFSQVKFQPDIIVTSSILKKHVQLKEYRKALVYLDSLLLINPNIGEYYYSRASINYYFSPRDHSGIVSDCIKAIENNFDNPEANYLLFSQICNCDGELGWGNFVFDDKEYGYSEAMEQIKLALDKKPLEEKYLIAKTKYLKGKSLPSKNPLSDEDYYSYKVDLENLISVTQNQEEVALCYYQIANIYLKFYKDTAQAITYLSNAISIDSNNVEFYSWRAYIKEKLGNISGAISDYSHYLNMKKDARIFLDRANCYFNMDNFKLAIADYTTAIQLFEKERIVRLQNKRNVDLFNEYLRNCYSGRGYSYVRINDKAKACYDFNKAIDFGFQRDHKFINEYCN